jgi:hypothetical protein
MMRPSKVGLDCLSIFNLQFFHHPLTDRVDSHDGRFCKLYQIVSWDQTAFVNRQSLQRCVGVSASVLHSLHWGSCGQPLFAKLLAVSIFLYSKIEAKKRHFGSVFAFQIGPMLRVFVLPRNCMR